MRSPAWRVAGLAVAAASALLVVTAAPTMASCVPPQMQTFDEPGTVVVSGTVSDLTDEAVGLVVDGWWGDGPRSSIAVQRPATDPTVISSTDWSPQLGERWIVAGRIEGEQLVTDVCRQWPTTAEAVAQVAGSLGDPATPQPNEAATTAPTLGSTADSPAGGEPSAGTPLAVLGAGAAIAIAVAGVTAILLARRRVS